MGVFSRFSDIINSNINALLDKAEDPEKIARLIIQEMEDTLVEVRTAAARAIAEKKALNRETEALREAAEEWTRKAELAVEKNREDLARGPLAQKRRLEESANVKSKQLALVEEPIGKAEDDMRKPPDRRDEAKAEHEALMTRRLPAENRRRARNHIGDTQIQATLGRYGLVERKVEALEAQVDAFDLTDGKSLSSQFRELEEHDK